MKLYHYKISEEELIERLRENDKTAFSILYDSYSTALYGVIKKVVKSDPPASDVLQDAFVKIWKNIAAFDTQKGKLFTWLLNIGRNSAIDRIRSEEYKKSTNAYDISTSLHEINTTNQHSFYVDGIGIEKILKQLKPEHKLILDLAYFEGYTQTEIAEKLNIPLGTVKTRVKMAMNHLKEQLKFEIN